MGGTALAAAAEVRPATDWVIRYREVEGCERQVPLSRCWSVRFEAVAPVRAFPSYQGQRNFPGLWWAATMGRHVGFESWLERDQVMLLDFDPEVVAVSAQPFWLGWADADGSRRHAPDFFARRRDGTGVVIDVRADDRIRPRDAEAFEVDFPRVCGGRAGCTGVSVRCRPVLAANLRWLAGYRHRRCLHEERACRLQDVFARPARLMDGARDVGDPIAVLPVLFHLMWSGVLVADLASAPLTGESVVAVGARS